MAHDPASPRHTKSSRIDGVRKSDMDFVIWLETTLIPDLHDSGMHETAKDFTRCCKIIRRMGKEAEDAKRSTSDPDRTGKAR